MAGGRRRRRRRRRRRGGAGGDRLVGGVAAAAAAVVLFADPEAAAAVRDAGAARVVPRGDGHPGVGDIRRRGGDAGVGGVGRRGGGVAVIDRDAARQRERLPVEKRWKNSSPGRTYFYLFFVLIETLTNPVMGWSNVSSARRVVLRVYVYTYVHARKLPLAAIRMYIQPTYV